MDTDSEALAASRGLTQKVNGLACLTSVFISVYPWFHSSTAGFGFMFSAGQAIGSGEGAPNRPSTMYRWTKRVPCRTSRPLFSIDMQFNHGETLRLREGGIFYVDWGLYIERLGRPGTGNHEWTPMDTNRGRRKGRKRGTFFIREFREWALISGFAFDHGFHGWGTGRKMEAGRLGFAAREPKDRKRGGGF
jgi:hypothetical protein